MQGWLQLICSVVLCGQAFGQVSERSLRALYGNSVGGSYQVGAGITMTTFDGPKDQAWVLKLYGPATDGPFTAIFDRAVPLRFRGLAVGTLTDCVGSCEEVMDYEKVTFISVVIAGQTASPSAMILFKSKVCRQRSKEARALGFTVVTQPKPVPK
jgi:hypothetical protein